MIALASFEQEERTERRLGAGRTVRAHEGSAGRTSWPEVLARGDEVLDGDGGMELRAAADERVFTEPFDAIELQVSVLLGNDPNEAT